MLAYEKEVCTVPFEVVCPDDEYTREIHVIDRTSENPYPDNVLVELNSIVEEEEDGEEDRISFDIVGAPAFSPDGKKLVALNFNVAAQQEGLVIYDIDTGEGQLVNDADYWEEKDLSGIVPAWSPQGDKIAYCLRRSYDQDTWQWQYEGDIYLINPDGSDETPLTDDQFTNIHPAWSPDGTQIAFVSDLDSPNGTLDIWIMDRNGTNKTRVLDCSSDCFTPSFTPDGKFLAFNQGVHIYILDLETGLHNLVSETGYLTSDIEVSPFIYLPEEESLNPTPRP
jgi:Tol biopolymer transport system component